RRPALLALPGRVLARRARHVLVHAHQGLHRAEDGEPERLRREHAGSEVAPGTSGGEGTALADRRPGLVARIGLVEATLVVMGGIVGSGIFVNPSVVARHVHSAPLILGAWVVGGVVALVGAFVYAELSERMPAVGGQYAYLREAFHPVVAFLC